MYKHKRLAVKIDGQWWYPKPPLDINKWKAYFRRADYIALTSSLKPYPDTGSLNMAVDRVSKT